MIAAHMVQLLGAGRLLARPTHVPVCLQLGGRQHPQMIIYGNAAPAPVIADCCLLLPRCTPCGHDSKHRQAAHVNNGQRAQQQALEKDRSFLCQSGTGAGSRGRFCLLCG